MSLLFQVKNATKLDRIILTAMGIQFSIFNTNSKNKTKQKTSKKTKQQTDVFKTFRKFQALEIH